MRNINRWVAFALVNLCLLALFGVMLRTKFLFYMPFVDYKNLLSAHSHFAFGGWVTLSLMILYIDKLLNAEEKQKNIYQYILGGIQVTSLGMLVTFPFQGYALFSLIFSTTYIFITYVFAWVFIRDLRKTRNSKPVKILAISALVSLTVSSVGPFYLAYLMATKSGTYFQILDAVYTFLHFQYNGFFTLTVLALFFADKYRNAHEVIKEKIQLFAVLICFSIIPALFLSLLWHSRNISILRVFAYVGCILIFLSLIAFARLLPTMKNYIWTRHTMARNLLIFSLISFLIKMVLQTGTIVPSLGNAVFGFRPVIIGFLHLVFLGLVSFYILSRYVEDGFISMQKPFARFALIFFSSAIFFHEVVLLVDGIGLLFKITNPIYGWLLWIAAILLFTGALLLALSKSKSRLTETKLEVT